ncbi:hypothetical protein BC826DRAFT_1088347, partial [Russula brevipes]
MAGSVFGGETNSFKCECPPHSRSDIFSQELPQSQMASVHGASSGGRSMALNADVISEILAATLAMPLWTTCEI